MRKRQMRACRMTLNWLAAAGAVLVVAYAMSPAASAQYDPKARKDRAAESESASKADYSKEFRKLAAPVQTAINEKKWAEVLAALPELEAIQNPTRDDRKAIATWKLQATQGVGDQDAFAAAIES